MKGYLMLTEVRSGSNWLTSLANSTGTMGNSDEWLGYRKLPKPHSEYRPDELYNYVMDASATSNGRFAVKIFTYHIKQVQRDFGFDFISRCMNDHDVTVVLLSRRDRIGQTISAVRAAQTHQWQSTTASDVTETYDFQALSKRYFSIGANYTFWRDYLELNDIPYTEFVYEDLLPDPSPLLTMLADHLGVSHPERWESGMRIQRDSVTDTWRNRFIDDIQKTGIFHGLMAKPWRKQAVKRFRKEYRRFKRFRLFKWR